MNVPRLSWLNLKQRKQVVSRKNAPGRKPEILEAYAENELRTQEETKKNESAT